ncbi:MAG: TatD family hydrolase [Lentisphaeraceae bacterium]|nr:TatD family hydrolase [Lentisphaeraceae bacterium]
MTLYDTHFHLKDDDSAADIISRARAANVNFLNLISCNKEDTKTNIAIAEKFDIYTSAGVHPLDTEGFDGDYAFFEEAIKHERVVGVGEIGLDYFYHKEEAQKQHQREIFSRFLQLSAQSGKPAIIHCRDAFEDCYAALKDNLNEQQSFIIHCYTGDLEWAAKFVELGAYISYSGILSFKNANSLKESVQAVPLERMLIETDSPYLAPVPHRGKRNEPAYVTHVLTALSNQLEMNEAKVAELTLANGKRAFNICG